ncbi:MAG: hypothetical protein H0U75_00455 [Legionella sp.]|nr:hypothetical protein [Legionella sp.]
MIVEVADIVQGYFSSLTFIDKRAGLVKAISKTDLDKNNHSVKKTFPVSCNVSAIDCINSGVYQDLMPNSNNKCILYLEDNGGIRLIGRNGRNFVFKASYRIVSWINNSKLGYMDCSVSGQIILALLNALPIQPTNEGIYQRLFVEVLGQDPKSYNPFSKYSYDEDKSQYLMRPFDYFSLPIEVEFHLHPSCAETFIEQTEINCNAVQTQNNYIAEPTANF